MSMDFQQRNIALEEHQLREYEKLRPIQLMRNEHDTTEYQQVNWKTEM